MSIRYSYRKLAEKEREELERVLLEQMDQQAWFSVAVISMWHLEIIVLLN
ncbi:MAG: hypothetical protein AABZ02_07005 [Bacteroidota bacterium]|jgi:hypothetical protein